MKPSSRAFQLEIHNDGFSVCNKFNNQFEVSTNIFFLDYSRVLAIFFFQGYSRRLLLCCFMMPRACLEKKYHLIKNFINKYIFRFYTIHYYSQYVHFKNEFCIPSKSIDTNHADYTCSSTISYESCNKPRSFTTKTWVMFLSIISKTFIHRYCSAMRNITLISSNL